MIVTSSDIKGLETCIGASKDGKKTKSEIGKIPISIIEDTAGDENKALTIHKGSVEDASEGKTTPTDDGSTGSKATGKIDKETYRETTNGGESGEKKGANALGALARSLVTIEKDKEDTKPGVE